MITEKRAANLITVSLPHKGGKWSEKVLLTSDAHWDNPHCYRDVLKAELDIALAGGHKIIIGGDFFCLMQGRYDPRRTLGHVRPEHDGPDYLNRVVNTAVEWLTPYAQNILFIHMGNHEDAVLKNCGQNVTQSLVDGLNLRCGTKIQHSGYKVWVRWFFQREKSSQRQSLTMLIHHGPKGGNAPVTHGIIKANRFQAAYEADIFWYQHIHTRWVLPCSRYRINKNLIEEATAGVHIQSGCYKDEQIGESSGYAIEQNHKPPGIGGSWLEFYAVKKTDATCWIKAKAYQTD